MLFTKLPLRISRAQIPHIGKTGPLVGSVRALDQPAIRQGADPEALLVASSRTAPRPVGARLNVEGWTMREGIHPEYHPVVFVDVSTGDEITQSTMTSADTKTIDGVDHYIVNCDITSHPPFFTGKQKLVDTEGGSIVSGVAMRLSKRRLQNQASQHRGGHWEGQASSDWRPCQSLPRPPATGVLAV